MTCYHPLKAYRSKTLTVNGKRQLVWNQKDSTGDVTEIACGQCMGCRLERSKQWAVRISHEASLYEKNCFITLTYSPEHLPSPPSLCVRDFQLFLKRLRKKYGPKIRFFHCGEYGEQLGRPHYHACLLNFDFPDKYHFRNNGRSDQIYRSPTLEELWGKGHCEIGAVTFESAAYVARYVTKKITGPQAAKHYLRVDTDTGEIYQLKPEYTTMSRRPGIGQPWLEKFATDVYPHDSVTIRGGTKIRPPRYYNNRYEVMHPEKYAKIEKQRLIKNSSNIVDKLRDNTRERLQAKETVHLRTVETLKRTMEK